MGAILCARENLRTLMPYQPGKPIEEVRRELGLLDVVKLASNENPLGPSPKALRAARKVLADSALYPDGACYCLRRALAARFHWKPEEIILGCGSNELLLLLGQAFLNPGDEVLTSEMTFGVYPAVAQIMNARLVAVPLKSYTYDLEAMARSVTSRTKLIFIANPNNPTGTAVKPKALERFVKQIPRHCLVVLDEAYYEYLDPKYRPDSLAWVRRRENVVVLRTFSKIYGLAGLRAGYGLVSRRVAEAVERVRAPFNVNHVAQAAATAALSDRAHVHRSAVLARRERNWLAAQLARCGFVTVPSQANFIFVSVPGGSGQKWFERLLKTGMIVRPFPGPYLRITAGTREQNRRLIKSVQKLLQAEKKRYAA